MSDTQQLSFHVAADAATVGKASFAFQPVNHKYNPFWRSVATSLFYVRTGVNLGYGAPCSFDAESIFPLEAHGTPNHYVQETLANWLEFYVGRYAGEDPVDGSGLPSRVMRGDLTEFVNNGEKYVPLKTLLTFLEDWYACACLEFVKTAFDPEAHKAHMEHYIATVKDMISPNAAAAAFEAASELSIAHRVEIINQILYEEFPVKPSRSKAFVPQLVILRGAAGASSVSVDARSAVTRGTGTVPLPPDIAHYNDTSPGKTEASHPDVVVMDDGSFELEDLFQPDRMFVVLGGTSASGDDSGCLFALEGHAPTFVDRGYMKRVTEGVLRDVLPSVSPKQAREVLATLYVGGAVAAVDVMDGTAREAETLELYPAPEHQAFFILTFRGSAWRDVAEDWNVVSQFLTARRFVVEGGRDMYLAAPSRPSKSKPRFRAAARLHAVDDTPDRFVAEVTTHRLSTDVEDYSGMPVVAVFLSGADAASLAFKASDRVAEAFTNVVTSMRTNVVLSESFGDRNVAASVLDHKSVMRLGDGQSLECACVGYIAMDADVAHVLEPNIRDVDAHTKYTPALCVGRQWYVGQRDEEKESETGGSVVLPKAVRVTALEDDPSAFRRRSGKQSIHIDENDVECISSSLQKGVLFNYLHLTILRAYADDSVRAAYGRLLEATRPLSGSRGDLRERLERDAETLKDLFR